MNRLLLIFILLLPGLSCTQFSFEEDIEPKPAKWESIFNGDTFLGWSYTGEGKWWIEDSTIHAWAKERESGHISSEQILDHFSFKMDFLINTGKFNLSLANNGVGEKGLMFDASSGFLGITGMEDETVEVKKQATFRTGEWNNLFLEIAQDKMQVSMNGEEILAISIQESDHKKINLQLPGEEESEVKFKNIQIRELTN